jgi:HEAT repeat protein
MQEAAQALQDLRDPDPMARMRAARWLAREALDESLVVRQAWMGNRGTTGPLIEALDDPESEVIENAVAAIAEISRRYFRDDRAYPAVVRLLRSKRRGTRFWAVAAAANLRGARCMDDVLPLIHDRSALVRGEVLRQLIHLAPARRLADRKRVHLLAVISPALKDSHRPIRSRAATLLGEIGDTAILKELRTALKKERQCGGYGQAVTVECIQTAIREILGRSKAPNRARRKD